VHDFSSQIKPIGSALLPSVPIEYRMSNKEFRMMK
jgi:AMMECR1 domain-containing protein